MSGTRDSSDTTGVRARKRPKGGQNGHKPASRAVSSDVLARLRHMEILISVSHKVAGLQSLDEVLATVVELAREHVAADRATLFLHDDRSRELYSRVAQGVRQREIRILDTAGIAGHVFQSGEGAIIDNAYGDPRFNRTIDEETGYRTETLLCAPIRTVRGEVIGVIQALNRRDGTFTADDLALLEAMTTQAAVALETTQFVERMEQSRRKELEFLDIVADITSELDLGALLRRVMEEATRMLGADRSTLFLNDEKTGQLFSRVAMGDGVGEIRLPNTAGIAGAVFTSGKTVNIPYAYADLRFNPSFDKQTGYFTRSILCVPVVNKDGKVIGVTQALNKRGGTFTAEDESRLKAFTAQVAISLENAKLFDDVRNMKNYNEGMLQSMSNAVITTNDEGLIVTCNRAGQSILHLDLADIIGKTAEQFFTGRNAWIVERIRKVEDTQAPDVMVDAEYVAGDDLLSVNINLLPLFDAENRKLGTMVMIEDISSEKRMKSTMSRYMDPGLVSQLLDGGEDFMEGKSTEATVLFSDIRGFTTITESLGAQGTVAMLNEYFTIMVDCITREGGMLDKFIGDAIMAAFGIPLAQGDDEDRAMRAAVAMIREMRAWNAKRVARGDLPIDMGIGLNTDAVVSGNIGSPKRMDYTIIGDGVNLAARLESACKQYGARILLSGQTVARLKGTYRLRVVDRVVVKGKTRPVDVYECLDYHDDATFPNLMDNVGYFNEAMKAYTRGDWDKAVDLFARANAATPADTLPGIYIERCELLMATPPRDAWDGVWRLTSK
jgi:adenylate cyclase